LLNWSKFGFGSVMSVPESAGRSLITNQDAEFLPATVSGGADSP
jgi:hypothetical protein